MLKLKLTCKRKGAEVLWACQYAKDTLSSEVLIKASAFH